MEHNDLEKMFVCEIGQADVGSGAVFKQRVRSQSLVRSKREPTALDTRDLSMMVFTSWIGRYLSWIATLYIEDADLESLEQKNRKSNVSKWSVELRWLDKVPILGGDRSMEMVVRHRS